MLYRSDILPPLLKALEQHSSVQASWQAGAAAFNRVDQWSDIDLAIIVDDNAHDEVIALTDSILADISPIELRHPVPATMWQGHKQVFYRLKDSSPFLMLDISFIASSAQDKMLCREIHGEPLVHFDKCGAIQFSPYDKEQEKAKIQERLPALARRFELYQVLVLKEIYRGNSIEALAFYHGFTLRPLVELLRSIYAPHHLDFHTRYIHYELPEAVLKRVESLFFVSNLADLQAKQQEAEQWCKEMEELAKNMWA